MSCKEIIEINSGPCKEIVEIRCGTPGPAGSVGPAGPQGPPGPTGGATGNSILELESFVLSAGDITNGYVTVVNPLANAENALVQIKFFGDLIPLEDYTWAPGTSRVNFAAPLLSRLIAGDQVFVRRLVAA